MNLPIYSSLKAKLESKGLDSTTSGQIAWFVCSMVFSWTIVFFINTINLSLDSFIYNLFQNNIIHTIKITILFAFVFSFLYYKSAIPLGLSFFISMCIFFLSYDMWYIIGYVTMAVLFVVCFLNRKFIASSLLILWGYYYFYVCITVIASYH